MSSKEKLNNGKFKCDIFWLVEPSAPSNSGRGPIGNVPYPVDRRTVVTWQEELQM
jgi:hypothetical protein